MAYSLTQINDAIHSDPQGFAQGLLAEAVFFSLLRDPLSYCH